MNDIDFLQVDTNSSLVRDVQTGAILAKKNDEFEAYLRKREKALQVKKQIEEQAQDIRNLKQDISDIKTMILQLVNRG